VCRNGGVVRKFKVWAGVVVGVGVLMAGGAWAQHNDPPQRIWHKQAPRVNGDVWHETPCQYFYDWTWIGDQDGDGCDELLISQEPYIRGYGARPPDPANRVELFLGDRDEISQDPAFAFEADDSLESMGLVVTYLGALTARDAHDFAIYSATYWHNPENPTWDRILYHELKIYQGGEGRLDADADFVFRRYTDTTIVDYRAPGGIFLRPLREPCDINNDGYNDLLAVEQDLEGVSTFQVYYGGEDFDTTPDYTLPNVFGTISTADFNGDGWVDILSDRGQFDFFLGGPDHPFTESVLTIPRNQYEGFGIGEVIGLKDVNGDGCDDWIFVMNYLNGPGGEPWLFFGGESLDSEPDRVLQIGNTKFGGGDVNDDGFGDVVAHTNIFFGSSWFDTERGVRWQNHDLQNYERTQGAYADYNGDGVNDHIISGGGMVIYAGNRDWVVSVGDEGPFPIPKEFTASAHPNPFNSSTIVTFDLPDRGELRYELFDLNGRSVGTFERKIYAPGQQSVLLNADRIPSGIFHISASLQSTGKVFDTTLKIVHID